MGMPADITRGQAAPQHDDDALDSALRDIAGHIGVFYRGDAERDAFLTTLIGSAAAHGRGVLYACDRDTPQEVEERHGGADDTVAEAVARRQVRVVPAGRAYYPDGTFDPHRTVVDFDHALGGLVRIGYPVTFLIGEMSWSLRGCPGTDRLLEYEALYSSALAPSATATMCLYDLDRTAGDQLYDLLRLHRRVVLNGIELPNRFVDPSVLLDGHAGGS